jgi:hypothetical protein
MNIDQFSHQTFNKVIPNENDGMYYHRNAFIYKYEKCMLEFDDVSLSVQEQKLKELSRDDLVWRAVYSGSKSIHFLFDISLLNIKNSEEYYFIRKLINEKLFKGLEACSGSKSPLNWTRSPGYMRTVKDKLVEQKLLYLDTNNENKLKMADMLSDWNNLIERKSDNESVNIPKYEIFNNKGNKDDLWLSSWIKKHPWWEEQLQWVISFMEDSKPEGLNLGWRYKNSLCYWFNFCETVGYNGEYSYSWNEIVKRWKNLKLHNDLNKVYSWMESCGSFDWDNKPDGEEIVKISINKVKPYIIEEIRYRDRNTLNKIIPYTRGEF